MHVELNAQPLQDVGGRSSHGKHREGHRHESGGQEESAIVPCREVLQVRHALQRQGKRHGAPETCNPEAHGERVSLKRNDPQFPPHPKHELPVSWRSNLAPPSCLVPPNHKACCCFAGMRFSGLRNAFTRSDTGYTLRILPTRMPTCTKGRGTEATSAHPLAVE